MNTCNNRIFKTHLFSGSLFTLYMGANHPMPSKLDDHAASMMAQYNLEAHHVAYLYHKFNEYDENSRGYWTIVEFNKFIMNNPEDLVTPCLEALLGLSSSSRDGRLSFSDFLVSICSYCALSKEELLQFFYIIMDRDRSGLLDRDELYAHFSATIKMRATFGPKGVYKQEIYPPNYLTALDQFKGGKWQSLMFEEFSWMCDLFPHMGFPVIYLQEKIRIRVLGKSFWDQWDAERLKIFHLEAESKSIQFTGHSLLTGAPMTITKPGRVSMKEVFEFTKRNGLKRVEYDPLDKVWKSTNGSNQKQTDYNQPTFFEDEGSYTKERDKILARAPLLNLIRNPNSVYYVPLDGSIDTYNRRLAGDATVGIEGGTTNTAFNRSVTKGTAVGGNNFLSALDKNKDDALFV